MKDGAKMSIAMEKFGSNTLPESRESGGSPGPSFPYRLQCRACGFESVDAIVHPLRCPKCKGGAWERFTLPRSLLLNARRRTDDSGGLQSSFAAADAT
jgi:hypothetical protein